MIHSSIFDHRASGVHATFTPGDPTGNSSPETLKFEKPWRSSCKRRGLLRNTEVKPGDSHCHRLTSRRELHISGKMIWKFLWSSWWSVGFSKHWPHGQNGWLTNGWLHFQWLFQPQNSWCIMNTQNIASPTKWPKEPSRSPRKLMVKEQQFWCTRQELPPKLYSNTYGWFSQLVYTTQNGWFTDLQWNIPSKWTMTGGSPYDKTATSPIRPRHPRHPRRPPRAHGHRIGAEELARSTQGAAGLGHHKKMDGNMGKISGNLWINGEK